MKPKVVLALLAALGVAIGVISSESPVEASAQRIFWTDNGTDTIESANLDGSNRQVVLSTLLVGSTRPAGIALASGKMYWTDLGDFPCQPSAGLYSANQDGSSPQALTTGFPFFGAQGVDIDTNTGKVHWGPTHRVFCGDNATIRTSNLDGSSPTPILSGAVCFFPGGLGLDLTGGKMYWGDASCQQLSRANLDGSNPQIPFVTPGCDVRDVDVDEAAGQVYFTCGFNGTIRRVKTDGTGLTTLVGGQNFPWGIELDVAAGKMYWAELNIGGPGRIRRANLDGSNVEDIVTGLVDPQGVAITPERPTPGKVTGGGQIEDPLFSPTGDLLSLPAIMLSPGGSAEANFGFVVNDGTTPKGNLLYDDHGAGVRIKATSFNFLSISSPGVTCPLTPGSKHAKFTGTAQVNGVSESLTVEVDDCAEPGSEPVAGPDQFSIDTDSYSNSGPLVRGNIQIHK